MASISGVCDDNEAWQVCTVMYCGGERGTDVPPLTPPWYVTGQLALMLTPAQLASSSSIALIGLDKMVLKDYEILAVVYLGSRV